MVKIAFIIDTIESASAGTEKQLLMLIKHLDRSRFRPYLCVLQPSEWLQQEFNLCPVFVADIHSFKSISVVRGMTGLVRFLKKEQINIVQVQFRDASIAGIIAARLSGIPAIVAARRNQGYWIRPIDRVISSVLNRFVKIFVANSFHTKKWVVEHEGISAERIKVIYNGVDLSTFQRTPVTQRKDYRIVLGIPENAPVVGIVANLRPVKAIDVFIRAAALVKKDFPHTRFLIVGEGIERNKLEHLARDLNLNGCLQFLGCREDVTALLSVFDIGVLSSSSERFSNAVVEYFSAGLDVVTTDVGGCREIIDGVGSGQVVDVGDWSALAESVKHYLQTMIIHRRNSTASVWVQKHCGIECVISQYNELYSGLHPESSFL